MKHNLRRWQFGIRALLVVMALVAIYLGRDVYLVRQRQHFLQLTNGGVGYTDGLKQLDRPQKSLPIGWSLLGAKPVHHLNLDRSRVSDDEIQRLRSLFPEAYINVYNGPDSSGKAPSKITKTRVSEPQK